MFIRNTGIGISAAAIIAVMALYCAEVSAAKQPKEDLWRTSEALVSRLGSEWYKIGVLRRDLLSISDVLADLRNLQLFPEEVTRLGDKGLVEFDRRIENIEKQRKKIEAQVNEFPQPLSDAVRIMRELTIDKPVKDMVRLLEEGDISRIDKMLAIKHSIDGLWSEVDSLTTAINSKMGLPPFPVGSTEELDREFFAILRANLGLQSEQYFININIMKDSLVKTRCNDLLRRQAFNTEASLIDGYISQKSWSVALNRAFSMKNRYDHPEGIARIQSVIAQCQFSLGDFRSSLNAASQIPPDMGFDTSRIIYVSQNLYALKDFRTLWGLRNNVDFSVIPPYTRNMILWVFMESGLAQNIDADYSVFAENVVREMPRYLNVMHALARSFILKKEYRTAVSILESAMQTPPRTEEDREAQRSLLLTLAQTRYENGEFDKSLKCYFDLLASENDFEQALYGIIWCYIRQGMFSKAEATLKKLVNQAPSHPLAAEATLLMGKYRINKAQFEWKKYTYLSNEYSRLVELRKNLDAKAADSSSGGTERIRLALREVTALINKIDADKPAGYAEIAADYDKALDICRLVRKYYETGSYQEITFSESREKLLHVIDSVLIAIENQNLSAVSFARSRKSSVMNRNKIKEIVTQSRVFAAEVNIDRYRWEMEYAQWSKSGISSQIKSTDKKAGLIEDTLQIAENKSDKNVLAGRLDSLINAEDRMREFWSDRIERECRDALEARLDTADEIYIRYHLGELWYTKENIASAKRAEEFDAKLAKLADSAAISIEEEPVISHDSSMECFREIIRKYPDRPEIAPAVYSLAWCYSDIGRFDSALINMTAIARKFPDSRYAPQAWMYLGERFFDSEQLVNAIEAYQSVLKYPESEWFDEALYKLAWSYYRRSNPGKAISSFLALVDLGEGRISGKSILEEESINYIAISFSESDPKGGKGLEQAALFADKLKDPERGAQILHRIANVYKQQGRYELSGQAYQKLLQKYPSDPRVPRFENDYISVLQRNMNLESAAKLKQDYYTKYNHESAWAKAQKDTSSVKTADSLAGERLHETAVAFHQLALQQSNNLDLYSTAAKAYEEYIRVYPDSKAANECQYNLAEISFSTGNYQRATQEYISVSKRYPDAKFRENAAWNAIVASQNLLKQEAAVR